MGGGGGPLPVTFSWAQHRPSARLGCLTPQHPPHFEHCTYVHTYIYVHIRLPCVRGQGCCIWTGQFRAADGRLGPAADGGLSLYPSPTVPTPPPSVPTPGLPCLPLTYLPPSIIRISHSNSAATPVPLFDHCGPAASEPRPMEELSLGCNCSNLGRYSIKSELRIVRKGLFTRRELIIVTPILHPAHLAAMYLFSLDDGTTLVIKESPCYLQCRRFWPWNKTLVFWYQSRRRWSFIKWEHLCIRGHKISSTKAIFLQPSQVSLLSPGAESHSCALDHDRFIAQWSMGQMKWLYALLGLYANLIRHSAHKKARQYCPSIFDSLWVWETWLAMSTIQVTDGKWNLIGALCWRRYTS